MQKLKRPVSIILSILMVVSMFVAVPVTASAAGDVAQIGNTKYDTLEAAFAAAQDGDTITVLANSNGNGIKVPQGKYTTGLTVDFGGYTYTVDGTLVGSTGTETQAFQLLKDNNITFENGTIYSEKALFLVQNYSNLTLNNMTLTLDNPNYAYAYTLSNNNGNTTINNSTINANPAGGYAFDVCRYSSYPSVSVTVTGDSFVNGDVEVSASGNNVQQGCTLNLQSGSIAGEVVVDQATQAAIEAAGNSSITENPTNFKHVVAQIEGGAKYETLEAAFAAAQDGDTITVLADSAGNGIIAPKGKFATGLTVDFGGHTYTVDGTTVGSTGTETQAFQLLMNNTITFKNGTLTSDKAKMIIQNYSNLTLDNMVIDGTQMAGDGNYALSNNNGNVVIKDTTITAREDCIAFDVCRYASYPSVNVTVKGNSVINGDVEIFASKGQAKDGFSLTLESGTLNGDIVVDPTAQSLIGDDNKVTKADGFTQTAPADFEWVSNGDGTSSLAAIEYVAKIGDTKYRTLEAAFAAAVDGDTITLLADCAGNGIKVTPAGKFATGLTVDFDGHTYTVDGETVGSPGTETLAFQLLKDNKVTFKNGTIYSEKAKMLVQNYCDLTLDNMTLTLNNTSYNGAYTLSNNNGSALIKDTTINANPTTGSFAFDVCRYSSYPSIDVTVTGNSVINGNVEIYASKGQAKDGFSLTLAGGEMTGDIVVDPTAQNLIGEDNKVTKADTFTKAAPAGFEWVDNGNGTSSLSHVHEYNDWAFNWTQDAQTGDWNCNKLTLTCSCGDTKEYDVTGFFGASAVTCTANDDGSFTYSVSKKVDDRTFVDTEELAADGHIKSAIQLKAAAKKGGTWELDNDLTGVTDVQCANGFVLNGNNHTVTRHANVSTQAVFRTTANPAAITLKNLTIDGIANQSDSKPAIATKMSNPSSGNVINLENVSIVNYDFDASNNGTILAWGQATVNMTDCNVVNDSTYDVWAGAAAKVNINGGEYGNVYLNSGSTAKATISDGTVAEIKCGSAIEKETVVIDPNNATVTTIPAGYTWVDSATTGMKTLDMSNKLFVGHNLTLGGNIGVNFFINSTFADFKTATKATVKFTWDNNEYSEEVNLKTMTPESGIYKASVEVVAAHMAHKIHAVVYIDGVALAETDDYSVQDYAEAVYKDNNQPEKLRALAKAMLNYGAEAQTVFASALKDHPARADSNLDEAADYTGVTAASVKKKINGTASDLNEVATQLDAKYYTNSLIYLQNNTLRIYFTPETYPSDMPNAGDYTGNLSNYYYYTDVAGIAAAELDEQQTFTVGDVTFKYSPLNYVADVLNSNMSPDQKNLAASLFLYNQAANEYF